MKCRFKIVGKRPGETTKYQLDGSLQTVGPKFKEIAEICRAYYQEKLEEDYLHLPAKTMPKAKTITITFTLP